MLRVRVVPCLLIRGPGLVKTTRFKDDKYVGDPINAVRIFNDKEADELIVLDIDASVAAKEPQYERILHLAAECRMPLCYGGGVTSAAQVKRIMSLGVEKVALSSAVVRRPELCAEIADQVGSQSVVAVLDVKRAAFGNNYRVFTGNGKVDTGLDPETLAPKLEAFGAGEIVVNSIDRDGTMVGYDLDIASRVRRRVSVPVTLLGGAGTMEHLRAAVSTLGPVGLSAGSLFVFKGKYRAVLINYPSREERLQLRVSSST